MDTPGSDPERDGPMMLGSSSRRRRARRRQRWVLFGIPALLALVVLGGWLWLRYGQGESEPQNAGLVDSVRPLAEDVDSSGPAPLSDSLELPALGASDTLIREVGEELSTHPGWASWLAPDDLVRRFVASVVTVSTGQSPRDHLSFLAPEEEFSVRDSGGRTVVDPASYRRYDWVAATFASLDTDRTVWLYRRLHPLFQEAYRELGFGEGTFDEALARAVEILLAVDVPEGPVEVVPDEAVYAFRDPGMEERSAAAKQLIRMGPENARRVQAKLRELAEALKLPGSRASSSAR